MDKTYDRKKKYVYMKVSRDKYELPLLVTDSVKEMARIEGKTEVNISSSISHNKGTYFRIEVEDE